MGFPSPPHSLPITHPAWIQYFNLLKNALDGDGNVTWDAVDKSGSKLSDLESRPHSDLTSILAADESSTDPSKNKHTSSNDLKVAVDHYNKEVDPSSANLIRDKHVADNDLRGLIKSTGVSTDNAIVIWDGVGGSAIQTSGVIIDDNDNISGATDVSASGTVETNDIIVNGVVSQSATYTILDSDFLILLDTSGGAFTITLPSVALNIGRIYHVKLENGGSNLTIAPDGSDTIDGEDSVIIEVENTSISLVGTTGVWRIV